MDYFDKWELNTDIKSSLLAKKKNVSSSGNFGRGIADQVGQKRTKEVDSKNFKSSKKIIKNPNLTRKEVKASGIKNETITVDDEKTKTNSKTKFKLPDAGRPVSSSKRLKIVALWIAKHTDNIKNEKENSSNNKQCLEHEKSSFDNKKKNTKESLTKNHKSIESNDKEQSCENPRKKSLLEDDSQLKYNKELPPVKRANGSTAENLLIKKRKKSFSEKSCSSVSDILKNPKQKFSKHLNKSLSCNSAVIKIESDLQDENNCQVSIETIETPKNTGCSYEKTKSEQFAPANIIKSRSKSKIIRPVAFSNEVFTVCASTQVTPSIAELKSYLEYLEESQKPKPLRYIVNLSPDESVKRIESPRCNMSKSIEKIIDHFEVKATTSTVHSQCFITLDSRFQVLNKRDMDLIEVFPIDFDANAESDPVRIHTIINRHHYQNIVSNDYLKNIPEILVTRVFSR